MIGYLRGELLEKGDDYVVLDVNGVGFVVYVPQRALEEMGGGGTVRLYTHMRVRENELSLYGFTEREELEIFRTLMEARGTGPKLALSIISHISIETLRQAVSRGEAAILARVPGVGAKKAGEIVFHLKGKLGTEEMWHAGVAISDTDGEVIAALTSLGYSVVEAQSALQSLPKEAREEPLEEKIRIALSNLSKL